MTELETILVGLDWEYTRNLLAAKHHGMSFVLYTKDNQTYLAAYTKKATSELATSELTANLFVGVRMDSPTAAVIAHTSRYIPYLFVVPASMAVVSAATLTAFPEL